MVRRPPDPVRLLRSAGAPVGVPCDECDVRWVLEFLARREVPALERVEETAYTRVVRCDVDARPVVVRLELREEGAGRVLRATSWPDRPAAVLRDLAVRMFDLDAPLSEFHALAARDPLLDGLVRHAPWIRLPQLLDPLEALVRAVLGQQVSVAAASTMAQRVVDRLGEPVADAPGGLRAFPTAAALAREGASLTGLGITRARASAIQAAATAALEGTLRRDALRSLSPDEADRSLRALRGVGPWTAAYVRMRALNDRDAFPATDLGVVQALARLAPAPPERRLAADLAERWRPWRAYAALHLWNSLSRDP